MNPTLLSPIGKSKPTSDRSGATAVEFAMVAPVAFLILFAAIELGRANMVFHSVEAAAYEGARIGILPGARASECRESATALLQICRVRGATVEVIPGNLTRNDSTVTIRIEVPYSANSPVVPFFTRNLIVRRECTLTRERLN